MKWIREMRLAVVGAVLASFAVGIALAERPVNVAEVPGRLTGWGTWPNGEPIEEGFPGGGDADGFVQVSAGYDCWIALREDGTVVTRGTGGKLNNPPPGDVVDVRLVAAGHQHFLALRDDGTIKVWGQAKPKTFAIPEGLDEVTAIGAGDEYNAALRADGRLFVWGAAIEDGMLAIMEPHLGDVAAFDAGYYCLAVLKRDGSAMAWKLSDENKFEREPPTEAPKLKAVVAGIDHPVGLSVDGAAYLWAEGTISSVPPEAPLTRLVMAGYHFFGEAEGGSWVMGRTGRERVDLDAGPMGALLTFDCEGGNNGAYGVGIASGYTRGFGETVVAGEELKAALAGFDEDLRKAGEEVDAWEERYLEGLEKIAGAAETAKRGEAAAEIREEMEEFRDRERPLSEMPALARMQKAYRADAGKLEAAREKRRMEIYAAAGRRLQELQDELTKAKKLREAVEVREEREKVEGALAYFGWKEAQAQLAGSLRKKFPPIAPEERIFEADDSYEPGELVLVGHYGKKEVEMPPPSKRSGLVNISAGSDGWIGVYEDGTLYGGGPGKKFSQESFPADLAPMREVYVGSGLIGLERVGRARIWARPGEEKFMATLEFPKEITDVRDVAMGSGHLVAVSGDGRVANLGPVYTRELLRWKEPSAIEDAVQCAAGYSFAAVLRKTGAVVVWNENGEVNYTGQRAMRDYVKIEGMGHDFMGLRSNGRLVKWYGTVALTPPVGLTDVVDFALGPQLFLALRADGSWVAWGDDEDGIIENGLAEKLRGVRRVAIGGSSNSRFVVGIRPVADERR